MDSMKKAYQVAAEAVRQRFAEQHPKDLGLLDKIQQQEIVVYSGSYDQVEKVLDCLQIPVTVDPTVSALQQAKAVFVNCSNHYQDDLVENIHDVVEAGLYLISSDWALDHVLEKAFPGKVRWTRTSTGEEVVSVEPSLNSLWSEVVVLGADPQWWLWGSHPIEVLDRKQVRIEAASHDLLQQYKAPVVAVSFEYGKGSVFHVISHYWAKRSGTPSVRHSGPCKDFLQAGMRLSKEGIQKVLHNTKTAPDELSFSVLQSAATATELVAQLCVRAVRNAAQP